MIKQNQKHSHFQGLMIGLILASMLFACGAVLASTEGVLFNQVNVMLDGKTLSKIGENYNSNPATITYHGTTYFPMRRASELFGAAIDYDSASKTVNLISMKSTQKETGLSEVQLDMIRNFVLFVLLVLSVISLLLIFQLKRLLKETKESKGPSA